MGCSCALLLQDRLRQRMAAERHQGGEKQTDDDNDVNDNNGRHTNIATAIAGIITYRLFMYGTSCM